MWCPAGSGGCFVLGEKDTALVGTLGFKLGLYLARRLDSSQPRSSSLSGGLGRQCRDMLNPGHSPCFRGFFWLLFSSRRLQIDPLVPSWYKAARDSCANVVSSLAHPKGGFMFYASISARFVRAAGLAVVLLVMPALAAAAGDAAAGKAKASLCFGCHGPEGRPAPGAAFPALAGQDAAYIARQLRKFKSGERQSDIMKAQAAGLSDTDIQ